MSSLLSLWIALSISPAAELSKIEWHPWSPEAFAQAKQEKKFVLLNLHAVWCHWCHVMEETTYRDPSVVALLQAKYVTVQVDADARPDLANRYEDYGWPATVVLAADGSEIVKRRGYLEPAEMSSLLQAIIDDPSPGPSVRPEPARNYAREAVLDLKRVAALEEVMRRNFDPKLGGWSGSQKFLNWLNVEYAMTAGLQGHKEFVALARKTLAGQLQLIDPVWGGVYQYSTDSDWVHPHFEKLIQFQSENLRVYALAYALWGDPAYLQAAERIHDYVRAFLTSPDGVFYVSQDADLRPGEHAGEYFKLGDEARRALGVPRVDTHLYARENGWMIRALVAFYRASGQKPLLQEALTATAWVAERRFLPGGGFRHDEVDVAGPYLGDTVAMGAAYLDLYGATTDRRHLQRAEEAAAFIAQHFAPEVQTQAGLLTADPHQTAAFHPQPQYDENVAAARFANLLFRYTAKAEHRALAECAFRYLATPEIGEEQGSANGGILLAGAELAGEPLHLTVVGARKDPLARELFQTALAAPTAYLRSEWLDPAEGKLPYQQLEYPTLPVAAAFVCSQHSCSPPLREAQALQRRLPHAPPE